MTFRDCWNLVSLHADAPDPMLCRAWTQFAYNRFCDRRKWSHLRAETVIIANDEKNGDCTVTQGSATVAGGTLLFAATDVGRQFRLGSIPIYTIIAVDPSGGTSATLERAYTEPSATQRMTILDAYVTMPEDFHSFISVLDPNNKWRIRFWVSQDQVNRWDPGRMSTGNAVLLASQAYSPVPGLGGRARYELYPFQTAFRTYPVWYYRKSENLTDEQEIVGPLARRASEVLLTGALAWCSRWPGTSGKKNPYFSLENAAGYAKAFEDQIAEITVTDEELYFEGMPLTEFNYADFPWTASWMQSHEPYIIG